MDSAALTPTPGSEFDEFLYTPIAEEHNGTLLNMVSAFARANVDPWDEAARLARLPREAATQFLRTLIAALPDGPTARTDPEALVQHLIALLPKRVASKGPAPSAEPIVQLTANPRALNRSLAFYIAVILFLLVNQWLKVHSSQETAHAGAAASAPASSVMPRTPAPTPAP
jgi:hypothetical protein